MKTPSQSRQPSVETRRCPVCAADTPHRFMYEKWGYPIWRCKQCGLGATGVRAGFAPESIYDEGYFQGGRPDGYGDYAGSEKVLRDEFRRSLDRLARAGTAGGRLLEVGCAYGFFLAEAQRNFSAVGVELSPAAAAFGRKRGLDVHQGTLTADFLQSQSPFDAAVMLDVIEHLPDPDETISLLHGALEPGGHLMLTTGDWDSLPARLLGSRWRLMTPPQHLFFFSRRNCIQLLEKHGFAIIECTLPWKRVPAGLIAYQLGNRAGVRIRALESISGISIPLNMFDAFRIIARKIRRA